LSTEEVKYRQAALDDVHAVTDLLVQLYDAEAAELLAENERLLQDRDQVFFLALVGERPVGVVHAALRHDYVNGTSTSPVGFLEGLFVLPAYRRRGIAGSLVDMCQVWAAEHGCRELASDALLDNEDSHRFHLSLGFEETERVVYFRRNIEQG
jgi:aminoglycoside 6'-N-acetyltransferase I